MYHSCSGNAIHDAEECEELRQDWQLSTDPSWVLFHSASDMQVWVKTSPGMSGVLFVAAVLAYRQGIAENMCTDMCGEPK